jgi:hypothetical protein
MPSWPLLYPRDCSRVSTGHLRRHVRIVLTDLLWILCSWVRAWGSPNSVASHLFFLQSVIVLQRPFSLLSHRLT